jgi:hypothetical protein
VIDDGELEKREMLIFKKRKRGEKTKLFSRPQVPNTLVPREHPSPYLACRRGSGHGHGGGHVGLRYTLALAWSESRYSQGQTAHSPKPSMRQLFCRK